MATLPPPFVVGLAVGRGLPFDVGDRVRSAAGERNYAILDISRA